MSCWLLSCCALLTVVSAALTPLDTYIRKVEPKFAWRDTGVVYDKLIFGSTAHMLNVTSLEWLDTTKAVGPNGALWTHQVLVVIPKKVTITNMSTVVMTGSCNADRGNGTGPSPPDSKDEYLVVADAIASNTGGVVVVVYQIPNCHYGTTPPFLRVPGVRACMLPACGCGGTCAVHLSVLASPRN